MLDQDINKEETPTMVENLQEENESAEILQESIDTRLSMLQSPFPRKVDSTRKSTMNNEGRNIDKYVGVGESKNKTTDRNIDSIRNEKDKGTDIHKQRPPSTRLPSLNVKTDPNLKSCLSLPGDARQYDTDRSSEQCEREIHPSFNIRPDVISPNMHGLLPLNPKGFPTPPLAEEFAHSHILHTPLVSSNSNSVLSSTPNSPPLAVGNRGRSPTSVSRKNSLRYSVENDKKIIEASRQSNNNSIVSCTDEYNMNTGDTKLHLLIGITGCISIHQNVFRIIEKFFELYTHDKLEIQVILTKAAEWFLKEKLHKFEELGVKVWFHDDNIKNYLKTKATRQFPPPQITTKVLSQFMLCYDLQKWTDVLLIAPLSANSMAKMINGLCDDLLTDLLHIWPMPQSSASVEVPKNQNNTVLTNNLLAPKPIIAALALTNSMYSHPITKRQLLLLQETYPNMCILKPVEKCVDMDGNISMGGMRSWGEVVDFVVKKLGTPTMSEDENDENEVNDNDDNDDEFDDDDENDSNDDCKEDDDNADADNEEDKE